MKEKKHDLPNTEPGKTDEAKSMPAHVGGGTGGRVRARARAERCAGGQRDLRKKGGHSRRAPTGESEGARGREGVSRCELQEGDQ